MKGLEDLTQYESIQNQIMRIVHSLIQKNRIINLETLLNACIRELKMDKISLLYAFDELEKEKKIIFGKKIIRDFVLNNEIRKNIYQLIKRKICVRYTQIKNELNLSPRTIQWNLEILLQFNCIEEVQYQKSVLYRIFETPNQLALLTFFCQNFQFNQILVLISKYGPCQVLELAEMCKISYDSAYLRIKTLIDYEILRYILEKDKKKLTFTKEIEGYLSKALSQINPEPDTLTQIKDSEANII
jgi:hypothetical protein